MEPSSLHSCGNENLLLYVFSILLFPLFPSTSVPHLFPPLLCAPPLPLLQWCSPSDGVKVYSNPVQAALYLPISLFLFLSPPPG
jgi:hypothetical protein